MIITLANVLYVLVAVAMIGFILVQRGPGADAGSGFGGGASATVFGASGSANFLSKSTAVLASLFFLLSMGMAIYAKNSNVSPVALSENLGVMSGVGAPAADGDSAGTPAVIPAADADAGSTDVPAAPVDDQAPGVDASSTAPASESDVPAATGGDAESAAAAPTAAEKTDASEKGDNN